MFAIIFTFYLHLDMVKDRLFELFERTVFQLKSSIHSDQLQIYMTGIVSFRMLLLFFLQNSTNKPSY